MKVSGAHYGGFIKNFFPFLLILLTQAFPIYF